MRGEKFSMHPEGHGSHKSHKPNFRARFKKSKSESSTYSDDSVPPPEPEKTSASTKSEDE